MQSNPDRNRAKEEMGIEESGRNTNAIKDLEGFGVGEIEGNRKGDE